MRHYSAFVLCCVFGMSSSAMATIEGYTSLKIDFTKPETASQITWCDAERLNLTKDGFGWDGDRQTFRDGWIETQPIALGRSWRPTQHARIRVWLQSSAPSSTKNGRATNLNMPQLFARYSVDAQHWSDWQPLDKKHDRQNANKVFFAGNLGVAGRSRQDYCDLLEVWSRRNDVDWGSDEEEFCRWLVAKEPQYFERHRPFLGYVQLLIEGTFHGGERLQNLDAGIDWNIGGEYTQANDPDSEKKHDTPVAWRFRGT